MVGKIGQGIIGYFDLNTRIKRGLKSRKGMIYLASPYSHPSEDVRLARFKAVNKATAKLISEGNIIYSAISHSHPIAIESDMPLGWDYWKRIDWFFLELSSKVIVLKLKGWDESKGVLEEIKYAKTLEKPVEYIEEI